VPDPQRQPSTLDATASILTALGGIGCLTLFLLIWIPLSAIVVYAIAGPTGAVVAGLIVAGIVVAVVAGVRKQRSLWRCPHCNGTFKPFQGAAATCPHCRRTLTPPPGTSIATPTQPTAPRPTRTCPECAETVLAAARRCRYCGFEFAD